MVKFLFNKWRLLILFERHGFGIIIFAFLYSVGAIPDCFVKVLFEADFEKLEGVTDVISGFTGGTLKNPTYNGNHEGHYEAVEITYDPDKISYKEFLDYYWIYIDHLICLDN